MPLFLADKHGKRLPKYLSDNWGQSSNAFIVEFLDAAVEGLACEMEEDESAYEDNYERYAKRFAELFEAADPLDKRFTDAQRLSMLEAVGYVPRDAITEVQSLLWSWVHDLCATRTTTAAKTKIIREISQIMSNL